MRGCKTCGVMGCTAHLEESQANRELAQRIVSVCFDSIIRVANEARVAQLLAAHDAEVARTARAEAFREADFAIGRFLGRCKEQLGNNIARGLTEELHKEMELLADTAVPQTVEGKP